MAILKIAKEGRTIEIPINIYEGDNAPKREQIGSYNINNGIITQTITVNMVIGDRRMYFPITYSNICNGVFLEDVPNDLDGKIYVSDISLDHFMLHIPCHTYNTDRTIKIVSTGY